MKYSILHSRALLSLCRTSQACCFEKMLLTFSLSISTEIVLLFIAVRDEYCLDTSNLLKNKTQFEWIVIFL